MSNIAAALRDRLKLRYMGNCKCGHCSLVPDELVALAADSTDAMAAVLRPFVKFLAAYPRPRIKVAAHDVVIASSGTAQITLADLECAQAVLEAVTAGSATRSTIPADPASPSGGRGP